LMTVCMTYSFWGGMHQKNIYLDTELTPNNTPS
jgi:hypothetical protein